MCGSRPLTAPEAALGLLLCVLAFAAMCAVSLSGCGGSGGGLPSGEHPPGGQWLGVGDLVPGHGKYIIKLQTHAATDPRDQPPDGSRPHDVGLVLGDLPPSDVNYRGPLGLTFADTAAGIGYVPFPCVLQRPVWQRAYTDATATDWTLVPVLDGGVRAPEPQIIIYGADVENHRLKVAVWY